jgi:hypothetical protein
LSAGQFSSAHPKHCKEEMVNHSNRKMAGTVVGILLLRCGSKAPAQNKNPLRKFELHADSLEFWNLISKRARLETVATGFDFTEGPVWHKSAVSCT